MASLERFARLTRDAKGLRHMQTLAALRWYIRNTPPDQFAEAVRRITDQSILKTLVEAGLKAEQMDAVVRRANELLERRGVR